MASGFSQTGYPLIFKPGDIVKDSCVGVSFPQMKKINVLKIERDGFKMLVDTLTFQKSILNGIINNGKLLVFNLEQEKKVYENSILIKDSIITLKDFKINKLQLDNDKLLKKKKNRGTLNAILYSIGGSLIAGLTTTVIILAK